MAYQLHKAFLQAEGISLMQVAARRPEALADFDARVPKAGLSRPLAEADIYILALSDRAVGPVSELLPVAGGLLAHTSGALGLEALICEDYLEVEAAMAETAPELVLGTQMERHSAKRLGIPCAVISTPMHVQDVPARISPTLL